MKPSPRPTVHELFDLTGRTALITGASGHLGSVLAEALSELGAHVIVASRNLKRAEAAAARLPGPADAVVIDQLDDSSVQRGFEEAVKKTGQLDVLVNNGHDPQPNDWKNVDAEQFTRQLSNATGYFLLARLLHDHATDRPAPANIVMIGSMYGVVASYPDAYEGVCQASPVAYHTLKGGIVHMTRHLAVYWGKENVRVNCLSPGPFPAPSAPAEMVRRLEGKSPMARMGAPQELKGALALLTSDAGSYITGQNLIVDGGWTAW